MHRTEDLRYWITERQTMLVRRIQGKRMKHGWSDDPYMGEVRYCNVRREDDAVTKWISANWRKAERKNLNLAMFMARLINLPETLNEIGYPYDWHPSEVKRTLRDRAARGEKVWTSAYTISTCGAKMPKEDYVVDVLLSRVATAPWAHDDFYGHTLAHVASKFQGIAGIGTFFAAQIVADLKNTAGHPLENAVDWHTWSAPGPGSLRGLSEYFERPITEREYHWAINTAYDEVVPKLSVSLIGDLHMQDFQNCLCEFSKYMRVRRGGHVRNKYRAG